MTAAVSTPSHLRISSPLALMLAVKVSASAVSCALPIIVRTPPRRPPLPPLSAVATRELLLLPPVSRRRNTYLLLPLTGGAAAPMICLLALPPPSIAAFEAKVGTNAAARQAAVDSAAIVATAPRDNMRGNPSEKTKQKKVAARVRVPPKSGVHHFFIFWVLRGPRFSPLYFYLHPHGVCWIDTRHTAANRNGSGPTMVRCRWP